MVEHLPLPGFVPLCRTLCQRLDQPGWNSKARPECGDGPVAPGPERRWQHHPISKMTRVWVSHPRDAHRPKVCTLYLPSLRSEGTGKTGCSPHPRPACDLRKQNCTRAYRAARNTPASLRNGFTVYVCFPENGSFASVACASYRKLNASTAAPRPHASPYAPARTYRALCVHRISPRVRDDASAPHCRETSGVMRLIWGERKRNIFHSRG